MERPKFRVSLRSPYPLELGVFWTVYDGMLYIALNNSARGMIIKYLKNG